MGYLAMLIIDARLFRRFRRYDYLTRRRLPFAARGRDDISLLPSDDSCHALCHAPMTLPEFIAAAPAAGLPLYATCKSL